LDVEELLHLPRDVLAVVERDPARLVQIDAQDPAAALPEELDVDELHARVGGDRLGERADPVDDPLGEGVAHGRKRKERARWRPLFEEVSEKAGVADSRWPPIGQGRKVRRVRGRWRRRPSPATLRRMETLLAAAIQLTSGPDRAA